MTYDPNHYATLANVKALAQRVKTEIETAIEELLVEQFLDQAKTQFVALFNWSSEAYPGSTNPNLDGKPVLVLALNSKDNETGQITTVNYSFLNMAALVDTYTVKDTSSKNALSIAGYEVELKIDPDSDNVLSVTDKGLMVEAQDVSGKVDKVTKNAEAFNPYDETEQPEQYEAFNSSYSMNGNIVTLDANGNIKDSGKKANDFILASDVATDEEVAELLDEIFGE